MDSAQQTLILVDAIFQLFYIVQFHVVKLLRIAKNHKWLLKLPQLVIETQPKGYDYINVLTSIDP
jgi:hypothetical protein